MRIFAIKSTGEHNGGMAIVAAHDKSEPLNLANEIVDDVWFTQYSKPDEIADLGVNCDGDPRVLTHYETGE